jgi:hypothetical protein
MTAWGNLPPALPPHGTVLAWARGCRCEDCEREYQRFVSELAMRRPLRLPAQPEPRKLDADTRARLDPAVFALTGVLILAAVPIAWRERKNGCLTVDA